MHTHRNLRRPRKISKAPQGVTSKIGKGPEGSFVFLRARRAAKDGHEALQGLIKALPLTMAVAWSLQPSHMQKIINELILALLRFAALGSEQRNKFHLARRFLVAGPRSAQAKTNIRRRVGLVAMRYEKEQENCSDLPPTSVLASKVCKIVFVRRPFAVQSVANSTALLPLRLRCPLSSWVGP